MSACRHGWTQPPECPTCVSDERDRLVASVESLQKELRHWRNEKFEQAVLAANVELKRQNAELELRLLDVVAEYESKMIDIHKQNAELREALIALQLAYSNDGIAVQANNVLSQQAITVALDLARKAIAAQPKEAK